MFHEKKTIIWHAAIASYIAKRPMIYKLVRSPLMFTPESAGSDIYEIFNNISDDHVIYYLFLLDENGLFN